MAAIDKIYLKTFEQYEIFKKWCEEQPSIKDKYGKQERITEYLYRWDKSWSSSEVPVFNAPCYIDAYIIRNCPFDFIQEHLKLMYSEESYNDIKSGKLYNSPLSFIKCEFGKHFKCIKHFGRKYNNGTWLIDLVWPSPDLGMWYNDGTWDFYDEYVISSSSSSATYVHSIKALGRLIHKKWKLPVGTIVRAFGKYSDEYYEFIIKK